MRPHPPQAAVQPSFGKTLQGPLAEIVVRNWGVLITLVGAMLIYGAYNAAARELVLGVAGVSKLAFILLVLAQDTRYLGQQAAIDIALDAIWVLPFTLYLPPMRRTASP